jgi:magnesium-transporting ATPase (P-type)
MTKTNKLAKLVHTVLDQPVTGFAPWILLAVVDSPHRVVLAAGLAGGLGAVLCAAGALTGKRPKLLDITAIIFFGALAVSAALVSAGTRHWLGVWSEELSDVAIAAVALVSLALRRPFTLQYARETTDRAYWNTPLFMRINYVITSVWAVVLLLTAVIGYIGDGPLHQPDNLWTNWIIPVGLIVVAVKFTGWYPDHATATISAGADPDSGGRHETGAAAIERRVGHLVKPLAVYLIPVGILVLIIGGRYWWIGVALIVVGIVTFRVLHRNRRPAAVSERQPS